MIRKPLMFLNVISSVMALVRLLAVCFGFFSEFLRHSFSVFLPLFGCGLCLRKDVHGLNLN